MGWHTVFEGGASSCFYCILMIKCVADTCIRLSTINGKDFDISGIKGPNVDTLFSFVRLFFPQ